MKFLLLPILLLPLTAFAQVNLQGVVIDSITNKPIPYASITIIKKNIGTNATANGTFIISTTKIDEADTLLISCVGFVTKKIAFANFPADNIFRLKQQNTILQNVIIKGILNKVVTLNAFSNCGFSSYTTNGFITQIAQLFTVDKNNTQLNKIEICKRQGKCIFRVRIYDVDSITNKPTVDLINEVIEVATAKKHVEINLEKYTINIPQKSFFIAVEWLFLDENKYKVKTNINGFKESDYNYDPNIFMDTNSKQRVIHYMKTFDGKWVEINYKNLLISCEVAY